MNERKYGALSSSVNPQELSLTVTSVAKVIIGMLIGFGVFTTTGADTTLEQIPVIVSAGYATWQAVEALWGAVRKIIVAVTAR
jgi:hypothetical protein